MRIATLLFCLVSGLSAAEKPAKPNVLFIFADDMTHATVGALGHPEVKTPNLDKLFQSGTTFTHTYNPGAWNGAVCIASRNMLMTGRHVWHAQREEPSLKQRKLWPQVMSEAGYTTYFTGKWHIKIQAERVFDNVANVRPGMPVDTKVGYNRPLEGQADPWDPADKKHGGFWKGGKHWSEVEADTAIKFLGQAKQDTKPFFFYLAFNAPHDPRQSPQEYLDMYPLEKLTLPKNFQPSYPYRDVMKSPHKLRDEFLAPMPRTKLAVLTARREYFALITHLDAQIGRVLAALDANGQRENTIIVFTTDHGLAAGRHGLLGKQNAYDHSIRVPYVINGPGIGKKAITSPIYLQDSYPTLLELAGVPVPTHVHYKSYAPVLKEGKAGRSQIYYGYRDSQRAIVKGGYKLVLYPGGPVFRLFNLAKDPLEMTDLLEKGEGKDLAKKLLADLVAEAKTHGDELRFPKFPN